MYKYVNIFRRGLDESQISPTRLINVQRPCQRKDNASLNLIPLPPRLTRRRFGFVSEGQSQAVGNSNRRDVVPSGSTLTG